MWTLERLLLGVGPEVGDQGVPELKYLIAELTGEDLQLALIKTGEGGEEDIVQHECISVVELIWQSDDQSITRSIA